MLITFDIEVSFLGFGDGYGGGRTTFTFTFEGMKLTFCIETAEQQEARGDSNKDGSNSLAGFQQKRFNVSSSSDSW